MHRGEFETFKGGEDYFASIVQYPDRHGAIGSIEPFLKAMASRSILNIVAADLLSLSLLKPPGEMGADVVVGTSQNFGIPLIFWRSSCGFFLQQEKSLFA